MIAVFFGGSIFVHELGHFLAARRRGVRVERFSIGFGPKIFGWRGKDGVEYRLSWFPLGGYVALPELADMRAIEGGTEEKIPDPTTPPKAPLTYSTKLIVFVAGAVCNIIFAFVLATILFFVGQPSDAAMESSRIGYVSPTITLPDGTEVASPASVAGIRIGDTVRAIDGKPVQRWMDLQQYIFTGTGRTENGRTAIVTIERDGVLTDLTVHPVLAGDEAYRRIGVAPYEEEFVIAEIEKNSLAAKAGFQIGDDIEALNGIPLYSGATLVEILAAAPAEPVEATVRRADGQRVTLTIPDRSKLKATEGLGLAFDPEKVLVYTAPWKQLLNHAQKTYDTLVSLVHPGSDVGISKLSGPVGIARVFHIVSHIDVRLVLWFTVLVNVNLAIFNLLPIPVLDGGHMLFATIAKLRGRALPQQAIINIQTAFMVMLFGMILYVTYFDVLRIARDRPATEETRPAESPAATNEPAAPAEPAEPAAP